MKTKIADLRGQRGKAYDEFKALAEKDVLSEDETKKFDELKTQIKGFDEQITRAVEASDLAAASAQPVAGQETEKVSASVETDKYVKDKSLVVGGIVKMLGKGGGEIYAARSHAKEVYGENHPVTKALATNTGASGGFMVPPDYMAEIIPLLRARAVVRSAGPRNIPMPRGTMRLPGQASAASASYGAENAKIASSQPGLNSIVASYKKLTALVPVSNDMMRYADPAVDAFVRDDLVKVMALREDQAFLLGNGQQDSPRGFLSFANGYAQAGGGTAGSFLTTGSSTAAVGGNFITSTSSYTLATAAQELGGLINKLDTANVIDTKRVWIFNPRIKNYLYNVQNSLGVYVYRDEMAKGLLLGYPFFTTTQIGTNYYDTGSNADCTFIMLAEMDETMILDSMQLELAVSREGTYIDGNGNTISAFQVDQTLIRAIAEHDFQLRHDAAVAVNQFVRWAPAIS